MSPDFSELWLGLIIIILINMIDNRMTISITSYAIVCALLIALHKGHFGSRSSQIIGVSFSETDSTDRNLKSITASEYGDGLVFRH